MTDAPAPRPHPLLPMALLFMIGSLWGFFFVLLKTGLTSGVSPMGYLFWFTLGTGSGLYIVGTLVGRRPRLRRAHLGYLVRLAALRFTLANIIFYIVQAKLTVGLMAVIMSFVPIITYAVSLVARIERASWARTAGMALGFAGVLLIVVPRSSLPDRSLIPWVALGFATPLMHAIAYTYLSEEKRPRDIDTLALSSFTLLTAAVLTLPLALAFGQFQWITPPFGLGERALLLHIAMATGNFYAIFELIRIAGPTYMSQSNFLSVGFGVVFGMVLLGERHSLYVWAAIALVLAGVALVNLRRS
jgi:drug/metabolite transporter (DMT)-like permease